MGGGGKSFRCVSLLLLPCFSPLDAAGVPIEVSVLLGSGIEPELPPEDVLSEREVRERERESLTERDSHRERVSHTESLSHRGPLTQRASHTESLSHMSPF